MLFLYNYLYYIIINNWLLNIIIYIIIIYIINKFFI